MSKKTGIIIPSYHQGEYLEKTIASVIANKKNADIEIALMDGGSKDETLDIIKKYENYFSAWCSEPDKGQAEAINKGIRALPDCDYYMWLNSDDVFEDELAVAKIAGFTEQNNYEVCYGLSHFIDKQGAVTGEYPVEPFDSKKLGSRCFLSQPSVLFSRKAYEETGPLNEQLKMCLDYEYWIRLAQKYEFGFLREYIGCTRLYDMTKTSTMQQRHLTEAIGILMQYYGRVPMHWIVTKILADNPDSILKYIPRRVLLVLLYPIKKRTIRKSLSNETFGL